MTTVNSFSLVPSFSSITNFFGGGTFENLINGNLDYLFGKKWNKVQYCVVSSKISYSCILPNIRFFIFTNLISFPFAFVGPTLSTVNILYLLLNYLPYLIKDIACILKALALGSLSLPSIPFPHIPLPFLPYLNQTLLDQAMSNQTMLNVDLFNQTMLTSNHSDLMALYNSYYFTNYMDKKSVDLLFP